VVISGRGVADELRLAMLGHGRAGSGASAAARQMPDLHRELRECAVRYPFGCRKLVRRQCAKTF
jgi:hypothetical protein